MRIAGFSMLKFGGGDVLSVDHLQEKLRQPSNWNLTLFPRKPVRQENAPLLLVAINVEDQFPLNRAVIARFLEKNVIRPEQSHTVGNAIHN
jgi:hypothetical protein